jgi:hypothetical protein
VKRIELRTPVARAVVPVLGGLAFFTVLGLLTWLFAALITRGDAQVTNLADDRFEVGPVTVVAEIVAEDGPILFPGLGTTTGERTLVLDHESTDPLRGWRLYYAHPADREQTCVVEQVPGTSTFVDCEGRTLDVTELAPPPGVYPVVEDQTTLVIDLREAVAASTTVTG